MKLSKSPSKIIGLRVGEVEINLLNPEQPHVITKFVLLREDGTHSGLYTKAGAWSEPAVKAFQEFLSALEEDVMKELFEEPNPEEPQPVVEESEDKPQDVPTLGDRKGVPQV